MYTGTLVGGNAAKERAYVATTEAGYNPSSAQVQVNRTSDGLIQEIGQRLDYLAKLSHRLENAADRACGMGASDSAGNAAPAPAPHSLVAKLGMIIEFMNGLTGSLEQTANRLDTFV